MGRWSIKLEYDADDNEYVAIVGSEGEHIATVHNQRIAQYMIDAMEFYVEKKGIVI